MGPHITAIVYGSAAVVMAFVLIPGSLRNATAFRGFAVWICALMVIMLMRDPLLSLAITGVVVLVFAAYGRERLPFYLIVAPAVPVNLAAMLSLPGINYLVTLTYIKMLTIILLAPLLIQKENGRPTNSTALGDTAITLYAMYLVMVALVTAAPGASSITSALRNLVEIMLILFIPFFAISRALRNEEDIEICLKGLLISSVIMASVALVSTAIDWDFYRLLDPAGSYTGTDYRYGFQRINATANTHSLGYLCGFGVVLLFHLKKTLGLNLFRFSAIAAVLVLGLLLTVSRGAILGTVVALATYYVFTRSNVSWRLTTVMLLLAGAVAAAIYLLTGDTKTVDPFASVEYRRLLFDTSIAFISENLWFGSPYFLFDPRFLPLLQGQGIIDITNLYFQVLLSQGLIGFSLLFMSTFIFLWRQGLAVLSAVTFRGPRARLDRQRALLCSGMLGWLALITTTSDSGLTFYIGVVLMGMMRGAFKLVPRGRNRQANVRNAPQSEWAGRKRLIENVTPVPAA